MIKTVRDGEYKLLETKGQTKILHLDDETYAWVNAEGIGEILVTSHNPLETDTTLSVGHYRLYDVKDNPHYYDNQHLELTAGEGVWQGYLLPTGLPSDGKKRSRIIPTTETISSSIG